MSSASSPRSLQAAEPEIARLSDDPADDDANAAPTKVGPMSKAFVDQMMFKAQLAESYPPSRGPVSEPPASGKRSRAPSSAAPALPAVAAPPARSAAPSVPPVRSAPLAPPAPPARPTRSAPNVPAARPAKLAVLNADDDGLPFEPTQLASAAMAPPVAPQRDLQVRSVRFPTAPLAFPTSPLAPPASSGTEAPWLTDLARKPRAKSDRRIAIELAVLIGGLGLIATAIVLWLFA